MRIRPIAPGARVRFHRGDADRTPGFPGGKDAALAATRSLRDRLEELQERLYADHRHRLLVVLQGMDTSGKDGTIRRVFEGVNPQGVRVAQFRRPSVEESDHDFLWRVAARLPGRGEIVIFNRSHYEDVLVVRVHGMVPRRVWSKRYAEINEFERSLVQEGTTVVKVYLQIDRAEQRRRLAERLRDPTKHWKFSLSDVEERRKWSSYMRAYAEMLQRTSTSWAPWFLVPANHRWYRDLAVTQLLVRTLEQLHPEYPPLPPGLRHLAFD
ncbi:MAG: polyphosphate kinase 2 family protein [Thermoplasmata archaeon]|nr:polyphosphate kinase 2 family protein [Thermoplasmata archaeon]